MTKKNEYIFRELVSYVNYGIDEHGEPVEALGDAVDEWGNYFCSNSECEADDLGDNWEKAKKHRCDD